MADKLILIDGNSILYRSFYALPPLALPDGRYTNAVYGFANIIIKVINEFKPTHMVVAFDVSKKTFRNDIYADYKGTRKPMPDELRAQIEPVKTMLKLMGIKILEKENIEADDILGTITKRFDDIESIIVTGDRDTLQLISPKTSIYFTKKGVSDIKVMDKEALQAEYGIKPEHIVDLKALQGDTADNIPGVAGIGAKIALDLVQEYGSIENIYANLENIKVRVKNKLEEGKESAEMSYKLAKINSDVDIPCEFNELTFDYPFKESVYSFMSEYKFNSILKREDIFTEEGREGTKLKFAAEKIETQEKLQKMVQVIEKNGYFSSFYDKDDNLYFATEDLEWYLICFLSLEMWTLFIK